MGVQESGDSARRVVTTDADGLDALAGAADVVVLRITRREIVAGRIGDVVDRLMVLSDRREHVQRHEGTLLLEIEGDIDAGLWPIFSSGPESGVVVFSGHGVARVHPEWWGATGDNAADDTDALVVALPPDVVDQIVHPVEATEER